MSSTFCEHKDQGECIALNFSDCLSGRRHCPNAVSIPAILWWTTFSLTQFKKERKRWRAPTLGSGQCTLYVCPAAFLPFQQPRYRRALLPSLARFERTLFVSSKFAANVCVEPMHIPLWACLVCPLFHLLLSCWYLHGVFNISVFIFIILLCMCYHFYLD